MGSDQLSDSQLVITGRITQPALSERVGDLVPIQIASEHK